MRLKAVQHYAILFFWTSYNSTICSDTIEYFIPLLSLPHKWKKKKLKFSNKMAHSRTYNFELNGKFPAAYSPRVNDAWICFLGVHENAIYWEGGLVRELQRQNTWNCDTIRSRNFLSPACLDRWPSGWILKADYGMLWGSRAGFTKVNFTLSSGRLTVRIWEEYQHNFMGPPVQLVLLETCSET
jgi:hypothetical protein